MKVLKTIAFSLSLGAVSGCAPASDIRNKEVDYRGGLNSFAIPEGWTEEYEPDGGGIFYEDRKDAGTLRLDVITASSGKPLSENEPIDILKGMSGVAQRTIVRLPNGNGFAKNTTHAVEQGTKIKLYWWFVTNLVRPKHVRIATFSYTVLQSLENDERTVNEIQMLDAAIKEARFHPELGVTTTH